MLLEVVLRILSNRRLASCDNMAVHLFKHHSSNEELCSVLISQLYGWECTTSQLVFIYDSESTVCDEDG